MLPLEEQRHALSGILNRRQSPPYTSRIAPQASIKWRSTFEEAVLIIFFSLFQRLELTEDIRNTVFSI